MFSGVNSMNLTICVSSMKPSFKSIKFDNYVAVEIATKYTSHLIQFCCTSSNLPHLLLLSFRTAEFTLNLMEFMKIIRFDVAIIRLFENKLKRRGIEFLTLSIN